MKRKPHKNTLVILVFILRIFLSSSALAQLPLRVLAVIAHPDDESVLSVTLYKLAKEQKGTVDLFVITNGEAGYRYSALAEQYYGCTLANAADARKKLPAIRRKELREAAAILGIAHVYYGNQRDSHYTLNEHEPLDTSWQLLTVRKKLNELLTRNHYDYVLCLLPEAGTHAGHKAATLLALNAVAALPVGTAPIILAAALRNKTDTALRFNGLANYQLTQTATALPLFVVDRTVSFGYAGRINYKIIADWELAAHKSQGATQMTMNSGDMEEFWYFSINGPDGQARATQLYYKLGQSPYVDTGGQIISSRLTAQTQ